MRFVYLDNFRGFQDALIPVLDVSFCVGENSSGKTSFLSAINLLSSSRFWFEQDFEGNETNFKHFDDYVSINSKNRANFRIGIAEAVESKSDKGGALGKKSTVHAFLFKYIEQAGLPRLECCTAVIGGVVITVYFQGRDVRYRIIESPKNIVLESFAGGLFDDWKAIQDDQSSAEMISIKDPQLSKGYFPPLYAISLALRHAAANKSNSKARNTFWFPSPAFGGDAAWIAPIRTKPQRTYDEVRLGFSPEGTHMPYTVKKMLTRGKKAEKFTVFLERFGKESGLFRHVKVHPFGRAKTSPFELEIVLESKPLNISNVGYGVSQVLPVVVEALVRPNGTLFAVQQPEVHLHPRAQASIGELLYVLASTEEKKFVVETHSDFTIDRFRTSMRDSKEKIGAQVLFFQRVNGKNLATQILIEPNGELAASQPSAYREFFLREELRVIGV